MSYSSTLAGGLLVVLLLPIWVPASALAQAPSRVMYEGFVRHEDGSVVNGEADLTFSLYLEESGGTALYRETQTLIVRYGNVGTEIGIVTPLDLSLFRDNTDLYLGVTVEAEPEWMPRRRLRARPYAASAAYAEDAWALQGLEPEDLLTGATPLAANVTYDNIGTDLTATTSQEAINALLARIQALESEIAQLRPGLQSQIDSNTDAIASLDSTTKDQEDRIIVIEGMNLDDRLTLVEGTTATNTTNIGKNTNDIGGLDSTTKDQERRIASIEEQNLDTRLTPVETKTASMSVSTVDGQPAIVYTGVNLVIRNGTGSTGMTNGTGNLVIGYNALRGDDTDARAGSHNLVLGDQNSHTSAAYGSLLSGHYNDVQNAYTATVAGFSNIASGTCASVTGGSSSEASGYSASVAGGDYNTASGSFASVAGGVSNTASGENASVAGGNSNQASGDYASVAGGLTNTASGESASVTGGYYNTAAAKSASVAGGYYNTANGSHASVAGGDYNTASGTYAAVAGGYNNTASYEDACVAGGWHNDASGYGASVAGGYRNEASGSFASVAGGGYNTASGTYASVAGGKENVASGYSSSVSGGHGRSVTDDYDWRAGDYFQEQ
jgi:hypothetical protein